MKLCPEERSPPCGSIQVFCRKSQIMLKQPLSNAKLAFAIIIAVALCSPFLYLMFSMNTPWPGLLAIALSQGFLIWKKRRSATN